MLKSAAIFIIMAAITTTVPLPVSRQYGIRWLTTLCLHNIDLLLLYYTDAAKSDVTTGNDVTVDTMTTTVVNATQRPKWTYYPFPYDSKLGWYTAAIISGLILLFLFCHGMEKAKHAIIDYLEAR